MGDTDALFTAEGDAPRAVIYKYIDEQHISVAYLAADANIKVEIPYPTTEKVVAGLLAFYYTWNREFPTVYANILHFFTHELLKMPLPNSSTLIRKFIRSRDDI